MPRPFRINAETGIKEFDDSFEPFEENCTRCGSPHKGNWEICDNCIDTLSHERETQLRIQQEMWEEEEYIAYMESKRLEEYLEQQEWE